MSTEKSKIRVAIGASLMPVGELIFETDGRRQTSVFTYADEWLENPNSFELAPSLPLNEYPQISTGNRENRRTALPGAISDTLPDSWGRGIIAKVLGGTPTELDFLVSVNDATRIGALRFLDDDSVPMAQWTDPVPRLNQLPDLRRLGAAYESQAKNIKEVAWEILGSSGGLGGARPKSDFDDGGTLSIAKFTSARDNLPVERAEVATLNMARLCGINAAEARLELLDTDHPVAIIKRFDREGERRRHYISAQTFLQAGHRDLKHYTDLADLMREYAAEPLAQLKELHSRIMFDCLIKNQDNHLRNHGFLYAGGRNQWVLSPAFDINPVPSKGHELETGISELSGNEGSVEAVIEAAPFFEIDQDDAVVRAKEMAQTISENWKRLFRQQGMTAAEVSAYSPAFEHKEMTYALGIGKSATATKSSDDDGP